MTRPHDNDNLDFDRLADGELSPRERQELLASLDGRPEGWRRCALALLESQTWRRELNTMIQEVSPSAVQVAAALPVPLPARPHRGANLPWVALAASLLAAFGVGWGVRGPAGSGNLSDQLAGSGDQAPHVGDSKDVVTLVVRDAEGRQQRVRLPLVEAGQLGREWAHTSPVVPAGLRAGLQNRGYDVRSERRFAPLFFEQDQQLVPMVVPVDDTYVVPVSRKVY